MAEWLAPVPPAVALALGFAVMAAPMMLALGLHIYTVQRLARAWRGRK